MERVAREPNDAHQRAPSSLMDPDARKFLTQEMLRFFDNKEYAKPEGYVPPAELTPPHNFCSIRDLFY